MRRDRYIASFIALLPACLFGQRGTLNMDLSKSHNACDVVELPAWPRIGLALQEHISDWPASSAYSEAELAFATSRSGVLVGLAAHLLVPQYYSGPGKPENPLFYPDSFAVDLEQGTLRRVSPAAWESASAAHLLGYPWSLRDDSKLTEQAKKFPATGHTGYAPARASTDLHYIAINSWQGTLGGGGPMWDWRVWPWPEKKAHGSLYVDVYDLKSGTLQFSLTGNFRGFVYPDAIFQYSTWLDDRYYVLPVDNFLKNKFVLCDVTRVSTGKQKESQPIKLGIEKRTK
jgi:hypothetical protein